MMKNRLQINNLTIHQKLISHFLLISIIPILVLGVLINWSTERILEDKSNETTMQLINNVNETFNFYIDNLRIVSFLIERNDVATSFFDRTEESPEISLAFKDELRAYLNEFAVLRPEIAGTLIVNSQGEYISNEFYVPAYHDLTQTSWYISAVQNKGVLKNVGRPIGRRFLSLVNYKNDEVVTVVRAVTDPETLEVEGVILIDMKLRVIAETVQKVQLGKNGYLMVVDKYGEIIYQPSKGNFGSSLTEWMSGKTSGYFKKEVEDKQYQFIFQQSSFADWITVGVFPSEETVFELRDINFYITFFIFLIILFGLPVSYFLSKSISNPIDHLATLVQEAETGQFSVRYKEKRNDEIGMLGNSFNKMLKKITELLRLSEMQEKKKRDAEFRSLQANINPHFLYNTLDTIQWMSRKQGAENVAEVVDSLAKFFRIGLSKGHDIIPLEKELEHVESYLQIQLTRYRTKLTYNITVTDSVIQYRVLKFILQPIVENAIYHGIKERRGPGTIKIDVNEKEGNLMICVKDDGKGIPSDQLVEIRKALANSIELTKDREYSKEGKAYGLLNVHARIKLMYGEEYGIRISSQEDIGTEVELRLPIIIDD